MSLRRREFKAAVCLLEKSMYGVAAELGISYNHLVLVLDGKRVGSQRLELAIAEVLRAARQYAALGPPTVPEVAQDPSGPEHRDVPIR